jgi:hypothetical protein
MLRRQPTFTFSILSISSQQTNAGKRPAASAVTRELFIIVIERIIVIEWIIVIERIIVIEWRIRSPPIR